MDPLAKLLNPPQLAAVRHGEGPLLILAGAGSGKTRVLTHRIAHLLRVGLARPAEVLAVTFTNKAAGELKERVAALVGPGAERLWVATFHAAGARILRREAEALELTRSFAIYDDGDQLAEVKRACSDLGMETSLAKPILSRIDRWKNEGLLPAQVVTGEFDKPGKDASLVYARYQKALQASNAVDFGDLIIRVNELFQTHPQIGQAYAERFRYVLVDEFQDTNPAQYQMLKLISREHGNLCVVGDDDQSIYRWRGAEVSNILDFPKDFPGALVVKLEQNYRSSGNILAAAHAVISRNARRAEKKLWTAAGAGEKLRVFAAEDERDEGARIATELYSENARGTSYSEMAVFYRANAQSRVLEDALRARRIPYRVVRGRSFYDRAEVKDVAAYLRLCVNPRADGDLLRIINTPPRGIGDTTVEHLRSSAGRAGVSLWEALEHMEEDPELPQNARAKLVPFRALITRLNASVQQEDAGAAEAIEQVLAETGLEDRLRLEGEEGEDRIENLHELLGAARDFDSAWAEAKASAALSANESRRAGEGAERSSTRSSDEGDRGATVSEEQRAQGSSAADEQRESRQPTADSRAQATESAPDPDADGDSIDSGEGEVSFDLGEAQLSQGAASAPGALGSAADAGHTPGERPDLRAALSAAAPDLEGEGFAADTALLGFLEQLALVGDADAEGGGDRVALMTLHAAKGLEFDAVWLTGMEERVFPNARALGLAGQGATGEVNEEELAEERRLCYVGMTRARRRLTLTFARCRSLFGELRFNPPSRFLREIPESLASGLSALAAADSRANISGGRSPWGGGNAPGWTRGNAGEWRGRGGDDFDQRTHADDDGPRSSGPGNAGQRRSGPGAAAGNAGSGSGHFGDRGRGAPLPQRNAARRESRVDPLAHPAPKQGPVDGFSPGSKVRHPSFGVGSVEELDGQGPNLKLTVRFAPGVGLKKILARFLQKL